MAESTLTLLYEDIANEISVLLYGVALYTDLDADEETDLARIIRNGYMQFLYPPATEGVEVGFEWSFMKPWTTLALIAQYDTGTVEVIDTTCTLVGGTFPTWVVDHGIMGIDGTAYTITARTDGTHLEVSASGDVTAGEDNWQIAHDGDYDLPDDFGRLIDGYYFSRDDQKRFIQGKYNEGRILKLRATYDEVGEPRIAAEVTKATDGTTGQRRQVWFYPRSNAAWTLHYQFAAFVGSFAAGEYPAGSMQFADVLRESCMASAEIRRWDKKGIHWDLFIEKFRSAAARDEKQEPKHVGNVGRLGQKSYPSDTIGNYTLQVGDNIIQE